MEYGGNNQDLDESVISCLAGGGYLNVYELLSGKEDYGTYVAVKDSDGKATGFEPRTGYTYQSNSSVNWSEDNFIDRVRSMNTMFNKVQYQLATKKSDGAGGGSLMFFNPKSNETATSTKSVRAVDVTYNTDNNGVGIAIEESKNEIVLLSTKASQFILNDIINYNIKTVETGYFDGEKWVKTADKAYTESNDDIAIEVDAYDCIRIETTQEILAEKPVYPISGNVNSNQYSWLFGETEEAQGKGTFNYSDEYGEIRIGIGTNDAVTKNDGVHFSGPSCNDSDILGCGSAQEINRYILIKPTYSGVLTMKVRFDGISGKAKGRFYYNDYGTQNSFENVDLSKLQKGYTVYGAQIGEDIVDAEVHTLTMQVEAGHTYAIHSYVYLGGIYLSEMCYTFDETKDMPIILNNLSVGSDGFLHGDVKYNNDISEKVVLLAVKYNQNGKLDKISMFDVVNEGAIDFGDYTLTEDEKVKLFVWNCLNDMKPLSRVYTEQDI